MKKIITLDSSQIKEFLFCPLSWYQKYHVNPEVAGKQNLHLAVEKRGALDKGTYVHLLLEKFYALKSDHEMTSEEAAYRVLEAKPNSSEIPEEECKHINLRFIQYASYWASRGDFRVLRGKDNSLGIEQGFSKVLYEDDKVIYVVEGRIDLLAEIQGQKCWVDHKSESIRGDIYKYTPQFLTYAWATGFDYAYINYFGMQKEYKEKTTFRREFIEFPEWKITDWAEKMTSIFKIIDNALYGGGNQFEAFYEMKNERSCSGAFDKFPCMFTPLCEIEPWNEKLRQHILDSKYVLTPKWEPWRVKEEA